MKRAVRAVLAVGLVVSPAPSLAFNWEPTEKQFSLFPEYCKAVMSNYIDNRRGRWSIQFPRNMEKIEFWQRRVAQDWHHMHHFCKGIANISAAWETGLKGKTARDRYDAFRVAARELHYSFIRSDPDYPFWEVIGLKYVEALHGAKRRGEAHEVLARIIKERPRSKEAYRLGARLRRREGRLNEGITYLEAGLDAGAEAGGLLYSLANLYHELGDFANAREAMTRAKAAGMKVERLKRRLSD
ncbi:hypothetical protein [Thiohalocapsa halophila]|uniref:hypothetical protein n=1 Tax=Thiohalocapsa halophila TaxID=69359 RepID=UPI001902DAF8|nr:hypothetical protein [Thiohalocapsa halophila]